MCEESPTFTRLRQTIGEPNRFRQAMKWRAAGDANGVARSTGGKKLETQISAAILFATQIPYCTVVVLTTSVLCGGGINHISTVRWWY